MRTRCALALVCVIQCLELTKCQQSGMACTVGFYGEKCDHRCSTTCNGGCNKDTGNCFSCVGNYALPDCSACHQGWYGNNCDIQCSPYCGLSKDFSRNRQCYKITGNCIDGCRSGWQTLKCDTPCPEHCSRGCHQLHSTCEGGCVVGWYGNTCEIPCSVPCTEYCHAAYRQCTATTVVQVSASTTASTFPNSTHFDNLTMEATSLVFTSGLTTSRTFPTANITTVEATSLVFTNGLTTSRTFPTVNITTVEACENHTYGVNCSLKCGHCSGDQACHTVTGSCPSGCRPGWYPDTCNMKCRPGLYGDSCTKICGHCLIIADCRADTGVCSTGCEERYMGDKCTRISPPDKESFLGPIVGAIICGSLIIGVSIIVSIILWRKRHKSPHIKDNDCLHAVYIADQLNQNVLQNAFDQHTYFEVVDNPYDFVNEDHLAHTE